MTLLTNTLDRILTYLHTSDSGAGLLITFACERPDEKGTAQPSGDEESAVFHGLSRRAAWDDCG